MGQTGEHIIHGQYRIASIVLGCAISAADSAQQTEDANEIQRSLAEAAVGESGQGNGNQLDAAEEQRQIVQPVPGVLTPET